MHLKRGRLAKELEVDLENVQHDSNMGTHTDTGDTIVDSDAADMDKCEGASMGTMDTDIPDA